MTPLDVIDGRARWHLHRGEALAFFRTLPDESAHKGKLLRGSPAPRR